MMTAVSVAALGLTAACGSSSTGGSGQQGVSGKTILVGFSTPKSGTAALLDEDTQAMIAYLKTINDAGGIEGYKFKWTEADNQGSVAGGATAARTLLSDKPYAIVTVTTAAFTGSEGVYRAQEHDMPIFGLCSGAAIAGAKLDNAFGLYTNYTEESVYMTKYASEGLGKKRIGLLYDPTLAPDAPKSDQAFADSAGSKIVKTVAVPSDTTNFTPLVQKLKSADVDSVLLMTLSPSTAGFVKAAKGAGFSVPFLTYSGNFDPNTIKLAGESAAQGLYVASLYPALSSGTPEVEKFRAATQKYAPDAFNAQGEAGWAAMIVFTSALRNTLQAHHSLEWSDFKNELYAMNGKMVGMSRIAYTKSDHSAIGGLHSLMMYRIQGDDFVKAPKQLS